MKIYSVQIVMPHSGQLTRAKVLTILKNTIEREFGRDANVKELCKEKINSMHITDVNYQLTGRLY